MAEENVSQELVLKNVFKRRNYLIEEIMQNELMNRKHKKNCTTLNYIEHFLILTSTITRWVSICVFASLSGIPTVICAITAGIKKYKSIIKKKKKNNEKILLLAKSNLNTIEALISKVLADSNVSHDEFVLINNVMKEFYDLKEEIKNSNNK